MSQRIFSRSNTNTVNDVSVSTLDMASTVGRNNFTGGGYSATSPMASDFNRNASLNNNVKPNNMFVKLGNLKQQGGNAGQVKSISSINQSELRNLFTSNIQPSFEQNNSEMPNNITDLIGRLQSMSDTQTQNGRAAQRQMGGNEPEDDTEARYYDEDADDADDADDHNFDGGGGNKEILDAMAKLNKHISQKAGIIFGKAMKVAKYYRDEAKKSNPSAGTIELNSLAMKLVDKDSAAGKLDSVVKRVHGASASRSKRSSKRTPKRAKGGKPAPKPKGKAKKNDDSSSPDSSDDMSGSGESGSGSELSFITTSDD